MRASQIEEVTSDVTGLLIKWQQGDEAAMEQLMPLVYTELHHLAKRHMHRERPDHTLNATALVHEAFLNLVDQSQISLESRSHFYAIASRVMRRVLIWYARRRNASKRGSGIRDIRIDNLELFTDQKSDALIALDEALEQLEGMDERMCRVVECRYFGGLSVDETSAVLGISPATVKRDWKTARAWLRSNLDS